MLGCNRDRYIDDSYRYVLLYPPQRIVDQCGSINGGPVAIPYLPNEHAFNLTVAGLLGLGHPGWAASPSLTTFRTALRSAYFDIPEYASQVGWRWFRKDWNDGPQSRLQWRGLWRTALRIPLIVPEAQRAPDDLLLTWLRRMIALVVCTLVAYVGLVSLAALPRRVLPTRRLNVVLSCILALALCPLWLLFWGVYCLLSPDPDICLMNYTSAVALIVIGGITGIGGGTFLFLRYATP